MKASVFLAIGLFWAMVSNAQDPNERAWFTPATNPVHADKPKVQGWATQRVEEKLNRGLVAVPGQGGGLYMSWRLMKSDPAGCTFNVYRSEAGKPAVRLNAAPITRTTDFTDPNPVQNGSTQYWITPIVNNTEGAASEKISVTPETFTRDYVASVKFQGEYGVQKLGVADLNGDGTLDYIIKQPGSSIDPGNAAGDTRGTTYKLEAYLSDGTFLWRKDLGLGIEPGIWYSPYVVFDFDGDGKAEIAVKTGPNERETNGRVTSGPEWVSILNGMTGEEITKTDWPPRDSRLGNYNRINRNQLGVAFLDGKTPSLLVARGTYKMMVVDAYQYQNGKLQKQWSWNGDEETPVIRSQGAHFMLSVDVDQDGRDEVILGAVTLDDNGTCLWSAGTGHPDKVYVTDIDPRRPGLESYLCVEPWNFDGKGVSMFDAATGRMLWSIGDTTMHVGGGMIGDIDPGHPGLETWAQEDPKCGWDFKYMFTATGQRIGSAADVPGERFFFWDADLLRETLGRTARTSAPADAPRPATGGTFQRSAMQPQSGGSSVYKYKGDSLTHNIQGSVVMTADILGDWREEIITVLSNGEIRVYTTSIPATDKRVSLIQDPAYRIQVAHLTMGYAQQPLTSYYMGLSPQESATRQPLVPFITNK